MWVIMSVQKPFDNKTAYKHTCRPPAHHHGSQTRPRAAPPSQLHRQCATNLPHHGYPRSVEVHRPYSAHCRRTRRGGKAPHTACSVPAPQISRKRMP
jgi:hypothetical protein